MDQKSEVDELKKKAIELENTQTTRCLNEEGKEGCRGQSLD